MTTLPRRSPSVLAGLLGLALLATPAAADTLFVDADLTTGAGDGSSWADAFQGDLGLQDALAAALPGDEIWVAAGSYRPTDDGSRTVSFRLKTGVAIYGSFAGGEASPAERPPFGTADSVLTGDLDGDDDTVGTGDNSFHVVHGAGSDATAILDGFVVRAGAATVGGSNRDRGAGILCINNTQPTIRHCRFLDHQAVFGGAAGYVNNGAAPTFTDCTFEDGDGGSFGGAFDIAGGGAVLFERCLFRGNTADRGGALEIFATNGVVVNNCVFRDNVATGSGGGGGGIWMGSGGNTAVRNCTIVANRSLQQNNGGMRNQGATNATVFNCLFWDNEGPGGAQGPNNQVNPATDVNYSIVEGTFGGVGVGNLDGDPQFVDAASGDYRLLSSSPAIDAGDTTAVVPGALIDFAGAPRLVDAPGVVDTGVGPAPVVDMGAHEFGSPWTDLGQGLAGTGGVAPTLVGGGELTAGSTATLDLSGALPGASAWLVVGFSELSAPFKGGVLVPDVDLLLGPLPVDGLGELSLSSPWPAGVPSGFESWWQEWIQDPGAPVGFAASNALLATAP